MADINQVITLGIGTPSGIKEFLTFGLQLGAGTPTPELTFGLLSTITDTQGLTSTITDTQGITSTITDTMGLSSEID